MDILKLFNETYYALEDELKKNIAKKIREKNKKMELKLEESRLLMETNFRELGITNKEGREGYVLEQTQDLRNELIDAQIEMLTSETSVEMLRYRIKYLLTLIKKLPDEVFYDTEFTGKADTE